MKEAVAAAAEAEDRFRRCLEIQERALDSQHKLISLNLMNLADALEVKLRFNDGHADDRPQQSREAQTEAMSLLYKRAREIQRAICLPETHREVRRAELYLSKNVAEEVFAAARVGKRAIVEGGATSLPQQCGSVELPHQAAGKKCQRPSAESETASVDQTSEFDDPLDPSPSPVRQRLNNGEATSFSFVAYSSSN